MSNESKMLTSDGETGFKVKIKTGGDGDKYLVVDANGALSWGDDASATYIDGTRTDPSTWKVSNKWLAVSGQSISFTGSVAPSGLALANGLLTSGNSCLGTNANGGIVLVPVTAIETSA